MLEEKLGRSGGRKDFAASPDEGYFPEKSGGRGGIIPLRGLSGSGFAEDLSLPHRLGRGGIACAASFPGMASLSTMPSSFHSEGVGFDWANC